MRLGWQFPKEPADAMNATGNRVGTAMKRMGVWSDNEMRAYLEQAIIPIRLAVQNKRGPLALSLWFIPIEGKLWCATSGSARLIDYLRAEPRCGFEVAADQPPYRGVRGQGVAHLHPQEGASILLRLLDRYGIAPGSALARNLLSRSDQELAIAIEPVTMTSWDFTVRMKGAVAV
jgi:hypothetical protein